ncbi:MAG TPA: hypothetical protein VH157_12280 [Bryobacteraceae bacterium]|nr:hypothetical protein [Bryobacteraceae bacterium]
MLLLIARPPLRFPPRASSVRQLAWRLPSFHHLAGAGAQGGQQGEASALAAIIRRSCYNKAHDLEHGFHTPAWLGES